VKGYRSILVGVDTDPTADMALRRAIDVARSCDAELHIAHSVYVPPGWWGAAPAVSVDVVSLQEATAEALWATVDGLLAEYPELVVHRHKLEGFPPDALLDTAEEIGAELIVLGTHGRGEVSSFLLGSTGHRVLAHASADVLVVKHEV
jgi:nucleotide-binding universal stress UspA family protein